MKNKVELLFTKIIDTVYKKYPGDMDNNYVAVSVYDCGGSYQVWLCYGKSGQSANYDLHVNDKKYFERNSLSLALKAMLKELYTKDTKFTLHKI